MRKNLAVLATALAIGCSSPETQSTRPQETPISRPASPQIAEFAGIYFDQLLAACDVAAANRPGHVTNLRALETRIREVKAITSDLPADEQLRRIHNYLFDHNAHRHAREAPAREIYSLAQPHRIISADLRDEARRVGSGLGLALEYFVLAGRFGHEVTPYLTERHGQTAIVFIGAGLLIEPTNPHGITDAREPQGTALTPANLLGLLLNTKGASETTEGKHEEAYKTYQRAYTLFPNADIALNLGETANLLANAVLARQWFEQTTLINPNGHTAHERLGELSFADNDFATAELHFMHALERCSTSGALYAKYAETLFMLDRRRDASVYFKRARDLLTHDPQLREGIDRYLEACTSR